MIERLKILKANRGQFANNSELSECLKTDEALRKEIETLTKAFLNRAVSGCSNCYADAYYELINLDIQKAMEKETCQFRLRAGALLRDVNGDISKNMTQANITDDLSLYHLKTKPNNRRLFHTLPENLDELLEEYELPEGAKVIEEKQTETKLEASADVEVEFNRIVGNYDKEIESLKNDLNVRDEKIIDLEKQLTEVSRNLVIEQARAENDVQKYVSVLTREELLELIKEDGLSIEVTNEMPIESVREAIITECEKEDAIDADAQKQAEDTLIIKIAERIKGGETRTSIKESLKDSIVGEKKLTQRFINDLVARADELSK